MVIESRLWLGLRWYGGRKSLLTRLQPRVSKMIQLQNQLLIKETHLLVKLLRKLNPDL